MKVITPLVLGSLFFMLLCPAGQAKARRSGAPCSGSQSAVSNAFAKAIVTLRAKTPVPPRLPTCVPGLGSGDDAYAIVKSADENGYVVVLGATPDCQGQHVCSYGTMIGTLHPLDQIAKYDVTRP